MAVRKPKRARSAAQLANDARLRAGVETAIEGASLADHTDPLAALIADPATATALAALVDAAVKARLSSAGAAPNTTSEMGQLTQAMSKMLKMHAMQMPGYFEPLPAEEVERRMAGKVEMFALLESHKRAGTPARYYVGPGKFYAGSVQHEEGEPIDTYLPPPEDFLPCFEGRGGREAGERAAKVLDAQMQWLGGPSPDIATRVSDAEAEAHSRAIPLVGNEMPGVKVGPVQQVEGVSRRETPFRATFAGIGETAVPGMGSMPIPPNAPGSRSAPARGPAFVE